MNTSISNNLSVIPVASRSFYAQRVVRLLAILLGFAVCQGSPVRAEDLREQGRYDGDALQIVTSALGLDELTRYSANSRAVGYGWANALGVEASYYDLGDSKFAKGRMLENQIKEDVGRRMDVKLAVDLSTTISSSARLFSRVGVYLWDVDVNYNRATRELNSSREGNSGLLALGAALAVNDARLSFEYEHLGSGTANDNRDAQRVLMHVSSKF